MMFCGCGVRILDGVMGIDSVVLSVIGSCGAWFGGGFGVFYVGFGVGVGGIVWFYVLCGRLEVVSVYVSVVVRCLSVFFVFVLLIGILSSLWCMMVLIVRLFLCIVIVVVVVTVVVFVVFCRRSVVVCVFLLIFLSIVVFL